MYQMTVDIEQTGTISFLPYHMCIPYLVVKRFACHKSRKLPLEKTRILQ